MEKIKEFLWLVFSALALAIGAAITGFIVEYLCNRYGITGYERLLLWLALAAVATPLKMFIMEARLHKAEEKEDILMLLSFLLFVPALPCYIFTSSIENWTLNRIIRKYDKYR